MKKLVRFSKNKIASVLAVALVLLCSAAFAGCALERALPNGSGAANMISPNDNEYAEIKALPVSYSAAAWAFAPQNLSSIIGYADYVFIGTVERFVRTDYILLKEGFEDDPRYSQPWSVFDVKVIKNIKGVLCDTIEVIRVGGLRKDGRVELVENTELPDIGGIYVFYAIAQEDGRLIMTGTAQNAEFDMQISSVGSSADIKLAERLESSKKLQELLDAEKSETIYQRQRHVASADAAAVVKDADAFFPTENEDAN